MLSNDINPLTWRNQFIKNYKTHYHEKLSIPRWDDIEESYDLRIDRNKKKAIEERDAAQKSLERIEKRVSTWKEKVDSAHTQRQKEQAENSLRKAEIALEKAKTKLLEKQSALDLFD